MLRCILLHICFYSSSFYNFRPFVKMCNIKAIKIIDKNMENKSIYDKFEYYSLIGDRKKQMECLKK